MQVMAVKYEGLLESSTLFKYNTNHTYYLACEYLSTQHSLLAVIIITSPELQNFRLLIHIFCNIEQVRRFVVSAHPPYTMLFTELHQAVTV